MQEENQVKQYTLALLLADKSGFDGEVWERYKQLGILHVLAISGLHISLMASVLQSFSGDAESLGEKNRWCINVLCCSMGLSSDGALVGHARLEWHPS